MNKETAERDEFIDALRDETRKLQTKAGYHRRESERQRQLFLQTQTQLDKITLKRKSYEQKKEQTIRRVWQDIND